MTDPQSREVQERGPAEDRRYRALASAVHFLDAARRELLALAGRVRRDGAEASQRDLDHLVDGMGSVLRLVLELDSHSREDMAPRSSSLGALPRVLRDIAAAREESLNERVADLLEELPDELHRCRHLVGARLEALAHERRS